MRPRNFPTLARPQHSHRMLDAVIAEIDGRDIRVGDQWLTDYASDSYLGLDLDEEIIAAVPEYLARWGTQPGGSRRHGSPVLCEEIEARVVDLLGAEDALVLPTVTHIHTSVIPALAGGGTLLVDQRADRTIHDGAALAGARGATVRSFAHHDLDELDRLLRGGRGSRPGMILVDGVDAMTGNVADLRGFAALAREHDAMLYVDDVHGFGVIGERSDEELAAYGTRGNGIVRHLDETYESIVLVGAFAKAYSSPPAFVACPPAIKRMLLSAPDLHCGPSPVASLATVLEGLRVNEQRGEILRARLARLTGRVLDRLDELDIPTTNESGLPIIQLAPADPGQMGETGEMLFERGVFAMLAVHPLVPPREVGFRLRLTAAHTDEQIDQLSVVLGELVERLRSRRPDAD